MKEYVLFWLVKELTGVAVALGVSIVVVVLYFIASYFINK